MATDDVTDRPLPPHIQRDLDRAAAGIGRTPTTAHPDCICHKVIGHRRMPWQDPDEPDLPIWGRQADCPQHRPDP